VTPSSIRQYAGENPICAATSARYHVYRAKLLRCGSKLYLPRAEIQGGKIRSAKIYSRNLALLLAAVIFSTAQAQTINPTGRTLTLQTPLELNGSVLGNLLTTIDKSDTISFETASLLAYLRERISEDLYNNLTALNQTQITAADLSALGIETRFDLGSLSVALDISAGQLAQRKLTITENRQFSEELSTPKGISGYANFRGLLSRRSSGESGQARTDAVAAVDSEIRFGGPVLEFSFELSDGNKFANQSVFERQYTRLVIDLPERESRVAFGDVEIKPGFLSTSTPLVGFSIERDYALTPGRIVKPTGQRKFTLTSPSKVTLIANNRTLRSFNLAAGNYDISDIPLAEGYNNLVLQVEDNSGRVEEIDFSTVFAGDLLAKGEIDYAFSAGFLTTLEGGTIKYQDEFASSGFIRYGALESTTIRHSLQLSDSLAIIETDGVTATRVGPLSTAIGLSLDSDRQVGWAVSAQIASARSASAISWSAGVEAQSNRFKSTLGDTVIFDEPTDKTLAGFLGVSTSLSDRRQLSGTVTHRTQDGDNRTALTASLSGDLSFGHGLRWLLRLRHEENGTGSDSTNLTLALNYQYDQTQSFDSLFSNVGPVAEVGATRRSKPGLVGGYDLDFVSRIEAQETADAELNLGYSGNRFETELSHSVQSELETDTDSAITRARLSSAIVFADRSVSVSRPVTNSFAIVKTHNTLGDRTLRLSPGTNGEIARSDRLGPAVIPDLGLYNTRSLSYSVDDLPIGYDLGTGVFFVAPPRGAGYSLEVGSAAVITVIGTLIDATAGESINLTSGTATPVHKSSFNPVEFFTNRTGKFALSGIAPGDYDIVLSSSPERRFKLHIPPEAPTLYRAGTISVP